MSTFDQMPSTETKDILTAFRERNRSGNRVKIASMNDLADAVVGQGTGCDKDAFLFALFGETDHGHPGQLVLPEIALTGIKKASRYRYAVGDPYLNLYDDVGNIPNVGLIGKSADQDVLDPVTYNLNRYDGEYIGRISVRGRYLGRRNMQTGERGADEEQLSIATFSRSSNSLSVSVRDEVYDKRILGISAIREYVMLNRSGSPDVLGAIDDQIARIRALAPNDVRYPSPAVGAFVD